MLSVSKLAASVPPSATLAAGAKAKQLQASGVTVYDFSLGEPDLANGETLFWAGGCASCHAAPDAKGEALLTLSGGQALKSPFGTFHVPNISSDPQHGIGGWTLAEFGDAMTRGVGRNGEHLYPSFPYASYARMTQKDVNDLFGYLKALPASQNDAGF